MRKLFNGTPAASVIYAGVFPCFSFFIDFSSYVCKVEKRIGVNWVTLLFSIREFADANLGPKTLKAY
jgi:transposase-like protein